MPAVSLQPTPGRARPGRVLLACESPNPVEADLRLHTLATAFGEAGWQVQWAGPGAWPKGKGALPAAHWPAPRPWPVLQRRLNEQPVALISRASQLLAKGWGHAPYLQTLLHGWQQILQAADPDWVVADGAPAAQLAANLLGVRVLQSGPDTLLQPMARPMPPLRWWLGTEQAAAAQIDDERLTHSLLKVLPSLGPVAGWVPSSAADVWRAQGRLVVSSPYLQRPGAQTAQVTWLRLPRADTGLGQSPAAPACVSLRPLHADVCAALESGRLMLLYPQDLDEWLRARHLQDRQLAVVVPPGAMPAQRRALELRAERLAHAQAGRYPEAPSVGPWCTAGELVAWCTRRLQTGDHDPGNPLGSDAYPPAAKG